MLVAQGRGVVVSEFEVAIDWVLKGLAEQASICYLLDLEILSSIDLELKEDLLSEIGCIIFLEPEFHSHELLWLLNVISRVLNV